VVNLTLKPLGNRRRPDRRTRHVPVVAALVVANVGTMWAEFAGLPRRGAPGDALIAASVLTLGVLTVTA
jgi:hypothetical protein